MLSLGMDDEDTKKRNVRMKKTIEIDNFNVL